ncbi:hypothetical protein [Staphylococcus phage LY01]|nr:hypothetical protein [Staphylococcus phage LY01]
MNFVHLDPLYEKFKSLKPEDFPIAENGLEDKLEQRVSNISIINYQITKLLELSYYRFCKDVGLEEEHLGLISMKNEYYQVNAPLYSDIQKDKFINCWNSSLIKSAA